MTSPRLGEASPETYHTQFEEKLQMTRAQFASVFDGEIETFASPASHYRMRAEFKIWQQGSKASYAMYEPGKYKTPVILEWEFSIGSKTITRLMPAVLKAVNESEELRVRLFQIEFLTTLDGECVITLIYHKPLDDDWEILAKKLEEKLGVAIIGRSRKQKRVLSKDFVTETLNVNGELYSYKQVETGFTQPNARICESMLTWAVNTTANGSGDLLELYCGNGNFTIPLSNNFDKVLATEISKTSVASALENIANNKKDNIVILRMSSEEFTEALNGEREFRRLADIDLDDYNFSTVFVDPPRAGLDDETVKLVSRFDRILYISCNPDTLLKNVESLSLTHGTTKMALFDQFPYTHHRECAAILEKR